MLGVHGVSTFFVDDFRASSDRHLCLGKASGSRSLLSHGLSSESFIKDSLAGQQQGPPKLALHLGGLRLELIHGQEKVQAKKSI